MLLLEVGDKLPHPVGTPTLFRERFLQSSRKPVINKESRKRLSRGHMSRTGRQGQMYPPPHTLRHPSSLRLLGVLIRGVLQHHLPVRGFSPEQDPSSGPSFLSPPPAAPPVFFRAARLVRAMQQGDPHLTFVRKRSMLGEGALQFYIETANHMIS